MITTIAFDPASHKTGWAIMTTSELGFELCKSGVIKAPKGEPDQRIEYMVESVINLLRDYGPDQAVIEEPRQMGSKKGVATYRKAAYRIINACVECLTMSNVYTFDCLTWKDDCKKEATIKDVNERFGLELEKKDNDEADAIGICDFFVRRQEGTNPFKPLHSGKTAER